MNENENTTPDGAAAPQEPVATADTTPEIVDPADANVCDGCQ